MKQSAPNHRGGRVWTQAWRISEPLSPPQTYEQSRLCIKHNVLSSLQPLVSLRLWDHGRTPHFVTDGLLEKPCSVLTLGTSSHLIPKHPWALRTDTLHKRNSDSWICQLFFPPAAANIGISSYRLYWVFGTEKREISFRCWAKERRNFRRRRMICSNSPYSTSRFRSKCNCQLLSC